jgi:hypothetical protein
MYKGEESTMNGTIKKKGLIMKTVEITQEQAKGEIK